MSLPLARAVVARNLRLRTPALARTCRLPLPQSVSLGLPGTARSYASKRKKRHEEESEDEKPAAADMFVPASQRISAGDVYFKAEDGMKAAVERYRKDLAALDARASGRVTPSMLAPVRVALHGHDAKVRLEEVATVGVREGTTLIVTVFEEHVRTRPSGGRRCCLPLSDRSDFEGCRASYLRCKASWCHSPEDGPTHHQDTNTKVLASTGRTSPY